MTNPSTQFQRQDRVFKFWFLLPEIMYSISKHKGINQIAWIRRMICVSFVQIKQKHSRSDHVEFWPVRGHLNLNVQVLSNGMPSYYFRQMFSTLLA